MQEHHRDEPAGLRPAESSAAVRPAAADRAQIPVAVFVAGCAVLALGSSIAVGFEPRGQPWAAIILMAVLGIVAERLDMNLYGDSRVSVSALFMLTTAVALGPTAVVIVNVAVAAAGHLGHGRPPHKLIFNASVFVLAGLAAFSVYHATRAMTPFDGRHFDALAVVLAALADFAVNTVLVAVVVSLSSRLSPRKVWTEDFSWLLPHYAVLGVLAFVLTLAYRGFGMYGVLGFVAPALMTRFSMKQYVDRTERTVFELRSKNANIDSLRHELAEAYNETLSAFVAALDTRDTETQGHSTRVMELSLAIGALLGIETESREWLDLKHGAILHDVGKIGVPDAILRKAGALTPEEWVSIREHPMHGYRMLREVRFLESAAELVLCHHERVDGEGYPRRLKGDEIPLGARIFTVADTFDAITSARPYKPARPDAEACAEIARHSGTQFDARVVAALLQLKRGASRQKAA